MFLDLNITFYLEMSFQVEKNFSVIFHLRPRLKMGRASPKEPFIKYVRKIFQKTNIPNPLIRLETLVFRNILRTYLMDDS